MAIEKLIINYKGKNKTWTNTRTENHKKNQDLKTDQTTDTTQKSKTYFKFFSLLTSSLGKIVNIHVFKYIYKSRNINVLFRQCGS